MSDNDSASSCASALQDISLDETVCVESSSSLPEPDENKSKDLRSISSDHSQSDQPSISESTTTSYLDSTLPVEHEIDSQEAARNRSPKSSQVSDVLLADSREKTPELSKDEDDTIASPQKELEDECIVKKVLPEHEIDIASPKIKQEVEEHQDDVESPKSKELKDESIEKELLPEQRSADGSPTKKHKKDEPVEKKTLEEQTDDVESSEEIVLEQRSADGSPTKTQTKDEPVDKETLEEQSDDVESSTEVQQEDDPIVEKYQDVVETPKSEEIVLEQKSADGSPTKTQTKDKPIDKKSLEEQSDNVDISTEVQQKDDPIVEKNQDVIESPKSEEVLAEQSSDDGSPTKTQKEDESIDKKTLEKRTDDVELSTEEQQEDDPIVEKYQDVVESPKKEEILPEQRSADGSPTKKHKKDEPVDKETLEKHTHDVESPKSEEVLAEQKIADRSPTKVQKKDEPIDKKPLEKRTEDVELSTEEQQEDDPIVEKYQDVVESPKSEELLLEQKSADGSPTKTQTKDEPIDKKTLEKGTDNVELSTKVQQKNNPIVEKYQDVVESPKSDEILPEQKSADGSPTKKHKKDEPVDKETLEKHTHDVELSTEVQQEDDSMVIKHQDVVESPKSEEVLAEQKVPDRSPTKIQQEDELIDKETLEKGTEDVELSTEEQHEDDPIVEKHQDVVGSSKSEEIFAEQRSADGSPTKIQKKNEPIDKKSLEKQTDDADISTEVPQKDYLIVKKYQDVVESPKSEEVLVEQSSPSGLPTKKHKKDEPIDKETLEKHTDDVELSTEVQQKDDSNVTKHQDVVESPKSEEVLAEQKIPDRSPTKTQKKNEPIDKTTLEKRTDDIELSTEVQQEDDPIAKKYEDVVELPKSEEILAEQESVGESDTKEQKIGVRIDREVEADHESVIFNTKSSEHGEDKPESSDKTDSHTLLDQKYFEYILKGFYKTDNIRVDECTGGDESSIQKSFMCMVKKFTLIGCKENTKKFRLSVIVKELHSESHQKLYNSDIAAKNEAIVYNTIFPILSNYRNITLPVPLCFFANDQQLIVQDLCGIEYKTFDKKRKFITLKECGYTLKALAKFHAASFVLKYKNNDKLQEIKNLTENVLYYGNYKESPLLKHQQHSIENILSIYTSSEQTENLEKIKALEYLITVAKNNIKDLLCKEQDDYVFCHGDLLLTNFLFKLNDNKRKKMKDYAEMDIKLIDFQKVTFCSVASDLVYLLFINLKPDDYINNKEDLLTKYFYYLKKNIIDCGCEDNFKLTYEWLLTEIDRFTEYGIIYALWIMPVFYSDDKDDEDQNKEVTQEILDQDSKKIFCNERMKSWISYYSTIYKKKFEK